jgi:hypothetical protein
VVAETHTHQVVVQVVLVQQTEGQAAVQAVLQVSVVVLQVNQVVALVVQV